MRVRDVDSRINEISVLCVFFLAFLGVFNCFEICLPFKASMPLSGFDNGGGYRMERVFLIYVRS